MFSQCDTDFNLERHLIPFLQDVAFFAEISRHLRKIPTNDIPTAAVTYDPTTDEMCLYWCPKFFESLSNWEIRGVLTHEFYHLVFGHLGARRRSPPRMWNIATDLAINSLIIDNSGRPRDVGENDRDARPLPRCALVPGQWPVHPDGREMSKDEKEAAKLASLIASFPKNQASEWYFNKLQEAAQKERQKRGQKGQPQPGDGQGQPGAGDPFEGEDWVDSLDDHDPWDGVPEEQREYIEGKVKAIVEKAVRKADAQSNGWGTIPAELREDIRKSISNIINWRSVLRQFIGTLIRGSRTTSIKRINRKYPYIHPGIKRGYTAKLLIARDESGSVIDSWLEDFFGELNVLTKKVEIDLLPFDCTASDKDIVRWGKGTVPKKAGIRTKGGGTNFDAPTRIFNDPKNRGRWDGLLILTDGGAPQPGSCRGKRGWVLAKGTELMFKTDELQIFMTKDKQMTGAWR